MSMRFLSSVPAALCLAMAASHLGCTSNPVGPPPPPPPPVPLTLAALSEAVGSSDGGAGFQLPGNGFQAGVRLTFGTVPTPVTLFQNTLYGLTPPHEPGTADLIVTNPDGQTATLPGAYQFVLPATLDFTGDWDGGAGTEGEVPLRFSIRQNQVISLACGGVAYGPPAHAVALSAPPPVVEGRFSVTTDEGGITGRIVSPTQAIGSLDVPFCAKGAMDFFVTRK
jgi:IPT/TIG domain-containing protein